MQRRWIVSSLLLLPALGAGYMTLATWRAGDSSKWLFGVFTVFLLALAVAPHVKDSSKPVPPVSNGFSPHWFMMLGAVAVVLLILGTLVGAIWRR
jgi:hypothetical protein